MIYYQITKPEELDLLQEDSLFIDDWDYAYQVLEPGRYCSPGNEDSEQAESVAFPVTVVYEPLRGKWGTYVNTQQARAYELMQLVQSLSESMKTAKGANFIEQR